jgi:hypothetical protein
MFSAQQLKAIFCYYSFWHTYYGVVIFFFRILEKNFITIIFKNLDVVFLFMTYISIKLYRIKLDKYSELKKYSEEAGNIHLDSKSKKIISIEWAGPPILIQGPGENKAYEEVSLGVHTSPSSEYPKEKPKIKKALTGLIKLLQEM